MDDAFEEWHREHDRLNAELRPYYDRISRKQGVQQNWYIPPPGLEYWHIPPTDEERILDDLGYFYNAALLNNGAVSSYVDFMTAHREAFEAIGAKGCLAALDRLLPLYQEELQLVTDQETKEYWDRTASDRENAEAIVEDPNIFARLLLAYAQRNATKIGTGLPIE